MAGRLHSFFFMVAFASAACAQTSYSPIGAGERLHWLLDENLSLPSMIGNMVVNAAIDAAYNSPKEYGPHWKGFGERVGLEATHYGVSTVMEAGLGSVWGEDPRYVRAPGRPFKNRLGHAIAMTFLARNRAGNTMPAYARLLAIPGESFLSNQWEPDSEATSGNAALRTGLIFVNRMADNIFEEFRPHH